MTLMIILMIFYHTSLHDKLVPVQFEIYEYLSKTDAD